MDIAREQMRLVAPADGAAQDLHGGDDWSFEEGCLSIPGLTASVERPSWVRVKAQDLDGNEFEVEGEELVARVLCHEIDHLDGKLFVEHLSPLKQRLIRQKFKKKHAQDGTA